MLPQVFKDVFLMAGRKLEDYLDFKRVDPLYRLRFNEGKDLNVWNEKDKLKQEIAKIFPGEEVGYQMWLDKHKIKFEKTYACLSLPYMHPYNYLRGKLLRALSVMQLHKSVHEVLDGYFKTEEMKMALGFQSKYLGMSPWHCPGAFSILSYAEHAFGIYHPIGGVHKISEAMAKVVNEHGGKINLSSGVKKIIIKNKTASGVELENGEIKYADHVIVNGDFANTITKLLDQKDRPSYSDKRIQNMKYSCSTLMFYFGVNKQYNIPHHNIFFGNNYKMNVDEIINGKGMPTDPAFYLQNASILDKSLAPEGKSAIYILVPVSNLAKDFPWEEKKKEIRDFIVNKIKERTELKDFDKHIEVEKMLTPYNWENTFDIHKGAVFNLSHNITQMLYLRPHNRFNDTKNIYLVGGGTHPGSGLPTILESGRIAADLISEN